MTDDLSMRVYRALLRLLPRDSRRHDQRELEAAFAACLERERARFGSAGTAWAWIRAFGDIVITAIVLRADDRRRRHLVATQRVAHTGDPVMISFWQEIRYAVRQIGRAPGFSAVVVVTLALAIGINTAIFSVVDGVLLRALPYHDPDRLVMLYEAIPRAFSGPVGFSPPDFKAFEARVRSFEAIAAFGGREVELSGIDQPERVRATRASAALFPVLGVPPALGRPFTREEDEGRVPVAILTDGLWRRKFAADPSIVGRSISLDRRAYTVIGIMPPGFVFPNRGPLLNNIPPDLYVPISFTEGELTGFASSFNNSVVGRLKPGVSVGDADAEARTVAGRLVQDVYPAEFLGLLLSASATPLRDETVGRVETVLLVLMAAVTLVLLIACADVANLMLMRAAIRAREMAVRSALGAGRAKLVRQILVEAAVLAGLGGVLGVFLAYWATGALVRFAPPTIPRLHAVTVDLRTLAFALALSGITALLCGLLPAVELSRRPSAEALKDGGRGGTAGVRQRRTFGVLVTAQFALAAVLLVAGGLLIRSFERLLSVDPGFRAERVLTMATSLPATAYPRASDVRGFYARLLERIDRLPGISAAGTATDLPLSTRERRAFTMERQPAAPPALPYVVAHDWVAGRYFDAMGIPLKSGRYLGPQDHAQSERVVLVNETMAKGFWPDRNPIGERIAWGGPGNHGPWMRIVGIVADVKQGPLNTATFQQTYQPSAQVNDEMVANTVWGGLRSLKVIVRSHTDPLALAAAVTSQMRALDPSLPVAAVKTMEEVVAESAGPHRFNTVLLGAFAGTALILAALGIAGVLATSVSRRTQELGVRMALGAQRGDLLRMVLRQGMTLVVVGVGTGVIAALALTRLMASLLFEVSPYDPLTFGGVAAVLLSVALIACYIPARRATRVDPLVALRYE